MVQVNFDLAVVSQAVTKGVLNLGFFPVGPGKVVMAHSDCIITVKQHVFVFKTYRRPGLNRKTGIFFD